MRRELDHIQTNNHFVTLISNTMSKHQLNQKCKLMVEVSEYISISIRKRYNSFLIALFH